VSAVASLYQPSAKFPLNLNRRSVEIGVLVQSLPKGYQVAPSSRMV
jgi:hypothetical protein